MFLVAIAWLYVTVLMALTETTVARGVVTFVVYGAFPLSIVMYLMGTPARRRRRRTLEAQDPSQALADRHTLPGTRTLSDPQASAASIASAPAAASPQAVDDATGSIQTQAASRPVTPSRRNE